MVSLCKLTRTSSDAKSAVKYTESGSVLVTAHTFEEPAGLREIGNVAVEVVVSDTGCGIPRTLPNI